MKDNTNKILIAHSAQQHSFRTAAALKKSGVLFKYITSVYDKEHSLTSLLKRFLKGDNLTRANTRSCDELDNTDVVQFCELESLILLFLYRVDKRKIIYNKWNNFIIGRFNKKVAKYAIKHNVDAVIMYDTLAYKTFKILKRKAPHIKRVLDMSAPAFSYMDNVFNIEQRKNNNYSDALKKEMASSLYSKSLKRSIEEISLTQYFLVASKFSEHSLISSGIEQSKILMCPYGIDSEVYLYDVKKINSIRKLRCIFIGTVTQKKGAFYLLETIKNIDCNKYSFKIVGTYDSDSKYYNDYKEICEFLGHVTKDRVVDYCRESDIMIFPSLADGFGLSALEAMSCGLPVICTSNSGISDLIIDGFNGFVIKPGSEKEIQEKLIWFDNNRDKLEIMSKNARDTALKCTWDKYDECVKRAAKEIFAE